MDTIVDYYLKPTFSLIENEVTTTSNQSLSLMRQISRSSASSTDDTSDTSIQIQ